MILERKNKRSTRKVLGVFLLLLAVLGLGYGGSFSSIISATRPVIRSIENRMVRYKTRHFKELETDTFIFRYDDIDDETLDLIMHTAEDKYKELTHIFGSKLEDQLLIVIYKDTDLMMHTTMLRKGDPPMGVYYGDSVHIANPKMWVANTEDMAYQFYREGPVLHELTHLYTDHFGRGNFPMWFTEGVSLYFEYSIDGYEWGKEVDFTENDYTLRELNTNFKGLNQYRAYTKSFRLVKSLVERHGLEKLMEIITSLGSGQSFESFIHLFEE